MVCPYPTATEFFSVGCGIGDGCYSKSSALSLLTIDVCIVISVVVLPKLSAACTAIQTDSKVHPHSVSTNSPDVPLALDYGCGIC